ncbi:MAG: flagellar basal body rod protein FlgB [Rhodocyclaceae bacterium]
MQPATPAPTGGGHGNHTAGQSLPASGQTFSSALSQAIGQASGGGHAGHGTGPGAATVPQANSSHATAGNQSGSTHPRHFTIGENHQGESHGFQETALGVRAYRQELIASNIANADTPGYKAVDIDFQEALRIARAVSNTPPLSLAITAAGHVQGKAQSGLAPYPLKYHVPLQPSADGNTVEMDVERAKFAENAVMWEFSRDRVSGHFKHIMEMLQNLKD